MVYSVTSNQHGFIVKHEVEGLYVGRDSYWVRHPKHATAFATKVDAEGMAKSMSDRERPRSNKIT